MHRRCLGHGLSVLAMIGAGLAAPGNLPAGEAAAATSAPAPVPYLPSMGDLMTMAVQPRHTKLGVAGQAGNWSYASYELSELRNAFARIARTLPLYNSANTAELVAAMIKQPLDAVDAAVKGQDPKAFKAAYAELTQACNACHASQNHAAVVVKVPQQNPYTDQEFRPASH